MSGWNASFPIIARATTHPRYVHPETTFSLLSKSLSVSFNRHDQWSWIPVQIWKLKLLLQIISYLSWRVEDPTKAWKAILTLKKKKSNGEKQWTEKGTRAFVFKDWRATLFSVLATEGVSGKVWTNEQYSWVENRAIFDCKVSFPSADGLSDIPPTLQGIKHGRWSSKSNFKRKCFTFTWIMD